MKKMFALIAICAMASSLMAVEFTDANYKNGALTVPVVYTGMLKINGWGDEGLCYNWQQTRNSYPLFLGLCQPCLDCVPCDIDMRHLEPQVQYGDNSDLYQPYATNATPDQTKANANASNVDQTEAYFNRARLYLVNDIDTRTRTATVKVVDLIDAYWGKDGHSATPVLFQFFNTVDSKGRVTTNAAYGRIGAMYQFPIYSRDFMTSMAVQTSRNTFGMANVAINQFNTDGNNQGHTNVAGPRNGNPAHDPANENCVADRVEDGIGLAALIGVKDYKAFFRVNGRAYPLVSIKALTGDFFAWQYNYTDNNFPIWQGRVKPTDGLIYQPQYVCRKGEDYVSYKNAITVPETDNPEFDGKGTWYATGSITLRRNDAVTRRMMADLNQNTTSVTCIPCNQGVNIPVCRTYLDAGVVTYLVERQFNNWNLTYIVDLDNDGIYGETADCGNTPANTRVEAFATADAYLSALVNTDRTNDASTSTYNYYNLNPASAQLDDGNTEELTR
jgi:hypothetical protein